MRFIEPDCLADFEFRLNWDSHDATHTDVLFARQANLWRDFFPGSMRDDLMAKAPGEKVAVACTTKGFGAGIDPARRLTLRRRQFRAPGGGPRLGRFYPQGQLSGVAGVYPASVRPFRCTGLELADIQVDLNHPLAGRDLKFEAVVRDVRDKPFERGGGLTHWLEAAAEGPGMQTRYNGSPTDFLAGNALKREDERPDAEFYLQPRMVQHIDSQAIAEIGKLYGRLLPENAVVLDLMASWTSHLPQHLEPADVIGLGLNAAELDANPLLTHRVVQDLNRQPQLPFDAHTFDGVVCTVSVEYLTRPLDVFEDVARVLRPGGRFVVTFSNRWFPTKSIAVWQELHEFERMGLVLEYFLQAGRFRDLHTLSIRGLPRPSDDKYYPRMLLSDPVYAVWGQV